MGIIEFGRAVGDKARRFAYEQEQKRQAQIDNARMREAQEMERLGQDAKMARMQEKQINERIKLQNDIARLKKKKLAAFPQQQEQGYGLAAVFGGRR